MSKKDKIIAGAKTFATSFKGENVSRVFDRALDVMVSPGSAWRKIFEEQRGVKSLFLEYVSVVAGFAAVIQIVGMMYFGVTQRDGSLYYPPLLDCLMVGTYIIGLSLALCYSLGVGMVSLGKRFGAELSLESMITLTSYSLTPVWFGYALSAIPQLSLFGNLIALYSLYILVTGIPLTTSPLPPEFRARFIGLACLLMAGGTLLVFFVLQGMNPRVPG